MIHLCHVTRRVSDIAKQKGFDIIVQQKDLEICISTKEGVTTPMHVSIICHTLHRNAQLRLLTGVTWNANCPL